MNGRNGRAGLRPAWNRAVPPATAEPIALYDDLGRDILARQGREGWGSEVIDHLAVDLSAAFPGMTGLSSRILKRMKHFAQEFPAARFGQQFAAQLPRPYQKRLPGLPQGAGPAMLSPEVRKRASSDLRSLGQAARCRGSRANRPCRLRQRRQPGTVPA